MNFLKDENKKDRFFCCLIAATIIFRIMIQVQLPLFIWGNSAEDDQLYIRYALELEQGKWLGDYDGGTLKKLPGFAFFLVMTDALNIPYSFALGLFYSLASLCFLMMLRKYVKSRLAQYLLFDIVLFAPIMFSNVALHVYNLAIGPSLTLFVVSSYLALYKECENGWKKMLPWIISASFFTGYSYIVRQDNIYLVLFAFGATVVTVVKILIQKGKRLKKALASVLVVIPLVIAYLMLQLICLINYRHYGLYVISDFTDTSFSDVCQDLMYIDDGLEITDKNVYVSRAAIDQAFSVSPTMCAIWEQYHSAVGRKIGVHEDGQLDREYFVWAIRWAAQDSGIYDYGAVTTNAYFEQVHKELEAAFENGTLKKRDITFISTMSPPLMQGDLGKIISHSIDKGMGSVIFFTMHDDIPSIYENDGAGAMVDLFEQVLDQDEFSVSQIKETKLREFGGWLISLEGKEVKILVEDGPNTVQLAFEDSPDLISIVGESYPQAAKCRFSYQCQSDDAYMTVYIGDDVYYEGWMSDFVFTDDDIIIGSIDYNKVPVVQTVPRGEISHPYSTERLVYMQWFSWLYWFLAIPVAILATIGFALELIWNIIRIVKKKNADIGWLILQLGVLLTMWVNQIIVSMNFYNYIPWGTHLFYTGNSYILWHVFCIISFINLGRIIRREDRK